MGAQDVLVVPPSTSCPMASTLWRTARLASILALIAALASSPFVRSEAKETHHHAHGDEHVEEHHGEHHHEHHDDHHSHEKHHHEHGHHEHQQKEHHHEHTQQSGQTGADAQNRWLKAYASAAGMSVISFAGCVLMGFFGMPSIQAAVEYICLAFAGSVLVADALLHLLPHALEGADHDAMTTT